MRASMLASLALAFAASFTPASTAGQTRPDDETLPYTRATPARHALLREGSRLIRVTGRATRDERHHSWTFTIDPGDTQSPRHELTLMPCNLLEEMERMIEAANDHRLVFEITGDVFVHRRRNYVMLTQPALLVGHEPGATPPGAPPGATAATGSAETPGAPDDAPDGAPDDESADEIIRDLERSVGRIPRRWAGEPRTERTDIADAVKPVLEGTVLLSRRGVIRRTRSGGFLFVFDADAEGLADPPMTLLPCLLLERLERFAAESTEDAAVLLTGYVSTHDGRNYLLPTVYRIPRERTAIVP